MERQSQRVYSARVAEITGLSAKHIKEAAHLYPGESSYCLCYGNYPESHWTYNVMAIANLAMLCGQVGAETGVYPLRGQNNVRGPVIWAACPIISFIPAGEDAEVRAKFVGLGSETTFMGSLTLTEMFRAAWLGNQGMYIMYETRYCRIQTHPVEKASRLWTSWYRYFPDRNLPPGPCGLTRGTFGDNEGLLLIRNGEYKESARFHL